MAYTDALLKARYLVRKSQIELRRLSAVVRKDKYDRIAAELQDLLLQKWNSAAKIAITDVLRAIKGPETFTVDQLQSMVDNLSEILGDRFAGEVASDMAEIQLNTYATGAADIIGLRPTFNLVDRRAIDALQKHNVYWVKNFFDNQLRDKTMEFGEKIIREGLNRSDAGALFREEFAKKFEAYSWRYWEGYANHVTTRSRVMGRISAFEQAEIVWAEIRGVRDRRQTEICKHLHGRRIKVSELVRVRDALIAAESPEDVKSIAPWPKPEDLESTPSDKLPDGAMLPPFHFGCRSDLVKWKEKKGMTSISDVAPTDAGAAQQYANRVEFAVANQDKLSKKEITNLVDFSKNAKWGDHKIKGKTTARHHYNYHGNSPHIQAKSLNDYNQKAIDLVRDPKREMYLTLRDGRHPQAIFRKGKNIVIIDVASQRIQTFHTRGDFDKLLAKTRHNKLSNARGVTKWLARLFISD